MILRGHQRALVAFVRSCPALAFILHWIARRRAQRLVERLRPWLPAEGWVLDIGAGTGHIAEAVERRGLDAVACDIVDLNFVKLPFVLADGARLPFASTVFDAALLITMLHHVPGGLHEAFLREALRVLKPGGRLLLMEDVYHGPLERKAVHWMDSLMNAEFAGHPHSNRSLSEWMALLGGLGLVPIHSSEHIAWYGPCRMRHALLVVER